MAFPERFLEELEEKNPIGDVVGSYVHLSRKGGRLWGLCPFHNEKTASFSVVEDQNFYYCFGCHKGGGVINFIMEVEGLDYPDAVRFLARRAGIEVPEDGQQNASAYRYQQKLLEICKEAARFYHQTLKSPQGQPGLQYLLGRGLTADTIVRFGLGFAPDSWDALYKHLTAKGYSRQELQDAGLIRVKARTSRDPDGSTREWESCTDWFRNRVMFPIIDVRGNVIGFGGRVMDGSEPKYLNSPESAIFNKRRNLFALNLARKTKMDMLVLTEGYMDTISMHQYGFDCAVASLGTALTDRQAALLAKYTRDMVLCYDGDEAGQNAAKRAISILEKTGVSVRVLRMQDAKDPDEYLKKFGAEKFRRLLEASEDQAAYQLETIRRKYDLGTDDGKVGFLQEAAAFIATLSSPVEQEVYTGRVSETAGVQTEAVRNEVRRAVSRRRYQEKRKTQRENLRPADSVKPASKSIRYDNMKSAMAEEEVLRQLFLEPANLSLTEALKPEDFSVELFGRVYQWMRDRTARGQGISVSALDGELTPEEQSHVVRISRKEGETVNEQALADCVQRIRAEASRRGSNDLMEAVNRRRDKKGYGG